MSLLLSVAGPPPVECVFEGESGAVALVPDSFASFLIWSRCLCGLSAVCVLLLLLLLMMLLLILVLLEEYFSSVFL